jgi:hypothetical protein
MPALAALAIVLAPATGRAQDAHHPPADLSKSYAATLGQMIALSATNILQTMRPVDAPMLAIFNGEKIEIWVLGVRSTTHGARETLDNFQEKGWAPLVAMIQALYGVKLTDHQVTVIYRNRGADDIEVIRLENGKYVTK